VSFLPLDLSSPDSLETVVSHIDYTMQYGEDEEPKEVLILRFRAIPHLTVFRQPHDLDEGDFADME
jgi:hypothetical protein